MIATYVTIKKNYFEVTDILLKEKDIDPSMNCNILIQTAFKKKQQHIVELIWKNKNVKKSLMNDSIELYNQLKTKNTLSNF